MSLNILTDEELSPLRHGFFTRQGGASSGVFAGLNCGPGSSDQAEIVAINRARAARALQVAAHQLVTLHQVHSPDVVTLDAPPNERPRADAMVTTTPGLALGVLTADCQPVLFADKDAHVIGAAHAGWRGALDGILEATVDAMERLGARREHIVATIGPAISHSAYEVGQDFFERFSDHDAKTAAFFMNGKPGKYHFDLPGYGVYRLQQAGVGKAHWLGRCTYSEPGQFFSYRRATHAREADYGRLISAIRL
ncbi:MAG: peptidoglycan editing factor PgeF [Pseudomonadota bacterium]